MAARGVLDALARLSGQGEIEERVAALETVILGDTNHEHQESGTETADGGETVDQPQAPDAEAGS